MKTLFRLNEVKDKLMTKFKSRRVWSNRVWDKRHEEDKIVVALIQ